MFFKSKVYNANFLTIFFKVRNKFKKDHRKEMSQTLQLLTTELKRARALTYYGKYPEAIEQFEKIQSGIQGEIFHIADKTLSLQWNKMLQEIKYEKSLVNTTVEMLSGKVDVKIPSRQTRQNDMADPNVGITSNNSSRKINHVYAKEDEVQRKPKRPFGKEPFKKRMHEDDEVYNRKQKQRRKQEQQEQRRQEQDHEKSNEKPSTPGNGDDEVWNQIFPKQKPTQKPVAKKSSSTSNQPSYNKIAQNPSLVGNEKNREYEKPWMKNVKKKDQKKADNKQNGGKQERKSFLKSAYPDGNGPDTNLIESLEREVVDLNPNITFDDIAELTKAKEILQEAVLLPLNFPELFVGNRRAWKGVLLFGPPGTGKTLLAKAVASSGATTFFNVTASTLASKWRGQSQRMVRLLFEMAKFYAPTTIFIDEIDSLASARGDKQDEASRRVKTELMTRIDGCTSSEQGKLITVIGATNRPWDLDEAIRRRLEKKIYIPLPTEIGRKELLRINLKNEKLESVDLEDVVRRTEGYSGADIANLCREAAYMPMRRKLKSEGRLGRKLNDPAWKEQFSQAVNIPLTMDDFNEALKNVKPSVGQGDLKHYMDWMEEFGQQGTK